MFPIGSINPYGSGGVPRIDAPLPKIDPGTIGTPPSAPGQSFGQVLQGLVSTVENKNLQAQDTTRNVLLGNNDQLHQSVIAMQEASVAFGMMIEVRNKLVESYQELIRMQV